MSRKKLGDVNVYVLDTSTIIHLPQIFDRLGDNIIITPISDLMELDGLKRHEGNVGFAAREAISCIEKLTNHDLNPSAIKNGVRTEGGGLLFFDYVKIADWDLIPNDIERNNDARVIIAAKKAHIQYPNHKVVILSEDSNLRVVARTCWIQAEGYRRDTLINNIDNLYSGVEKIDIPNPSGDLKNRVLQQLKVSVDEIVDFAPKKMLYPNQCVEITIEGRFVLGILEGKDVRILPLDYRGVSTMNQSMPKIILKNNEQKLGYNLMLNPTLDLITFSGTPGSGKTFLALMAAYVQSREDDSKRIMVFRPHVDLGPEFGILPGGINEKFAPWVRPIIENLNKIAQMLHGYSIFNARTHIEDMIHHGMLEINPISHIRGCTFDDAYIVIDEGQNLTPHEMRSTVTRAGANSRIFITGDPTQVDNRFLDSRNNGLVFLTERFKGDANFGHLTFRRSVRSSLAERASNLLA